MEQTSPTPPPVEWTYVAFDPGETTGIAAWDEGCSLRTGRPVHIDQLDQAGLDKFLEETLADRNPKVFIVEDYMINPAKMQAHFWSKGETMQIIGQIKSYARRHNIEVVLQGSKILPIAQKWSGQKLPANHKHSHWISAFNHGYYYLVNKDLVNMRVLSDGK